MKKLLFIIVCATFSMGMNAGTYYVDAALATSGDGSTWALAKKTIAEAFTASGNSASIIYVAAGTYNETIGSGNTANIAYYGGYPSGNSGTDISNRNITSNITIIDGGGARKGVTITRANYVVDGFTIQNCVSGANSRGGAVSLTNNGTIRNCIIKNSTLTTSNAKWAGAGVYMTGGTVEDCQIFGNSTAATGSGAGVYICGGTLQRCKVYNNTATTLGGGVLVGNATNSAIDKILNANVVVANCLIYNNSKEGLYVSSVAANTFTVQIINNTVVNNALPIVITDVAPTAMVSGSNNIFYGNTSNETFTPGTAFTYNAIQAASVTGTGNVAITATDNSQTAFVSPTATKGIIADQSSANWNLLSGSVCKDAGTGSGNGSTDIAGSTRVYNTIIDMGAYESQAVALLPSTITATGSISFNYTGTPQGPSSSSVTGSTGTVTFSYSGTGGTTYTATATKPTAAGTYQVIASVAADATYAAATSVAYAFTIVAIAPSAPTITLITPATHQLSVAFTAGDDGGSIILNYQYSTDDGATFTPCSPVQISSPIVITGLTNETLYKVQIKAVNAIDAGAATASTSGTPTIGTDISSNHIFQNSVLVVSNGIKISTKANVEVISFSGKMIWKGLSNNETIELAQGAYIVKATFGQKVEVTKVIIR